MSAATTPEAQALRQLDAGRPASSSRAAPGELSVYICGPTVYNYIHIGNARPFWVGQVLQRFVDAAARLEACASSSTSRTSTTRSTSAPASRAWRRASSPRATAAGLRRGHRPARARPARRRAARDRDDPADHRADRGARASGGSPTPPAATCTSASSAFPGYGELSGQRVEELIAGARIEPGEAQGVARRLRALEGDEARRGRLVAVALGARAARLAHRVLGDGARAPRRRLRRARRRPRPGVPAPRERARPERGRGRDPFTRRWLHNGMLRLSRREDVEVARQRRAAARRARPRRARDAARVLRRRASYRMPIDYHERALEQAPRSPTRFRETLRNARRYARAGASGADDGRRRRSARDAAARVRRGAGRRPRHARRRWPCCTGSPSELNAAVGGGRRRPAAVGGRGRQPARRALGARAATRSTRAPTRPSVPAEVVGARRASARRARAARDFARVRRAARRDRARAATSVRDTPQGPELVPRDAAT